MKLVVFGLAVSSSWGNGHATLWRGLGRALAAAGHRLVFIERDRSFYAAHRDPLPLPGLEVVIYPDWPAVAGRAAAELADADAGIVTSYCPDTQPAVELLFEARIGCRCFYDLDTPVTFAALDAGETVAYLPAEGLGGFDLVLSYTGGPALDRLRAELGARRVAALYGSVDPEAHRPAPPRAALAADLSYLGTHSRDRQAALERLLLAPARARPDLRFLVGGAQYPADTSWPANVRLIPHVAPGDHSEFYASSPLTLNITRAPMAALGHCPAARLFEAAACGVPVLSDVWDGLSDFFEPGTEILLADEPGAALEALALPAAHKLAIGRRARARVLARHTAAHRAAELIDLVRGGDTC
jgi:spore maturation protein CgeB